MARCAQHSYILTYVPLAFIALA